MSNEFKTKEQLINELDLIEFLPDATFVINKAKEVIAWNRAMEELTGVRKEDIVGKGDYAYGVAFYGKPVPLLVDLIFSYDRETEQRYGFIERKGDTLYVKIFLQEVFNGKGAYLWAKASPLYDSDSNIVGAIESIRDITEQSVLAQLQQEAAERKLIEESLWNQQARLKKQLHFSSALNHIAEKIILNEDTLIILEIMTEIVGETLCVDRCLIYNIDFIRHQLIGLCEWLNTETPNITATKDTYNRDIFLNGTDYMMKYRKTVQSHVDDINPILISDGSAEVLHKLMDIQSGLWHPFSFREQGYFCLVFNQVSHQRVWHEEEIDFIIAVAKLVEIAIQKINFLNKQKKAEEALRFSDERFYKAFNSSPNPMAIYTFEEGYHIDVNDIYLKVLGFRREEVIGCTPVELGFWAKLEHRYKMRQILEEKGSVRDLDIEFRTKKGEVRLGLLSAEMIDLNGEQCILCVVNDNTERKALELEIYRLDRLNLVGEMAAGIGHEIRNPMTTVRGFLQMLGGKEECVRHKEYFNLMIEELDRANSIITEFLSLAKNKAVDLKAQNLNNIVEAIFPLIQADAIRSDKYINMELENTPDLLLDDKEIRQLILNLFRNGLESMSPGGSLTIKTFTDGKEVVLAVKDQGKGIETDTLDKLGTPFYTTKDTGTGLGLAVCYSIAARHNATIKVETNSGGTTFFVRFKIPHKCPNI